MQWRGTPEIEQCCDSNHYRGASVQRHLWITPVPPSILSCVGRLASHTCFFELYEHCSHTCRAQDLVGRTWEPVRQNLMMQDNDYCH